MRLAILLLSLAMFVTACAKKPAPQSPKSNAAGATDSAPAETKATPDSTTAPAPGGDDASHTRGPVPKGGAKTGDPCEGGQ